MNAVNNSSGKQCKKRVRKRVDTRIYVCVSVKKKPSTRSAFSSSMILASACNSAEISENLEKLKT